MDIIHIMLNLFLSISDGLSWKLATEENNLIYYLFILLV